MRKKSSPRRHRQPKFEQLEAKRLMATDPIQVNDDIIGHFLSGEIRGTSPQDNQRLDTLITQHRDVEQRLNNGEQHQYDLRNHWDLRSQIPSNFSSRFAFHNGTGLTVTGQLGVSSQTLPGVTLASGDTALDLSFRTSRTGNQTLHFGFNLFSNQRLEILMQEAGTLTVQAGTFAQRASKGYSQVQASKLQPNSDYTLRLTVQGDTATVELFSQQTRLVRTGISFYQQRSPTDLIIMAGTASIIELKTYSIQTLTDLRQQFFSKLTDETFKALGGRDTQPAWLDVPTSDDIFEAVSQQVGARLTQADRQNAIGFILDQEIAQWSSLASDTPLTQPELIDFKREIDDLVEKLWQFALPYDRGKIQLGPNDAGFIEAIATVESAHAATFEMEFSELRNGQIIQTIRLPIAISENTTTASTTATMRPSSIFHYRVVIKDAAGKTIRTAEYRPNQAIVKQDYLAWESGLLIAQPIVPQLRVIAIRNNAIVFNAATPFDQSQIIVSSLSSSNAWWATTSISHMGGREFQNVLVSLEPMDGTQTVRLQNAQGQILAEVPITSKVLRDSRRNITGMSLSVAPEFWFSPEEQAASLASSLPASVNGQWDLNNALAREAALQKLQSQVTQAHELVQNFPRHVGAAGKFNRDNLVEQSRFFMSRQNYTALMERLNPDLFPLDQEAWIQAQLRARPGFSYAQIRRGLIDNQADARRRWGQDLSNYIEDLAGVLEQAELVLEEVRSGQLAITQAEARLADRIRSARLRVPQGITRPTSLDLLQEVQRLSNEERFVQARSQLFFNVNNGYITSHYSDSSLQLLYNRARPNNSGSNQDKYQTAPNESESRRIARLNRLQELAKESGTDPRIRALLEQLKISGSAEVTTERATYVVRQRSLTQASSVPMVVREFNAKLEQAVLDEDAKQMGQTYGGSVAGAPIYYSVNNGVVEATSLEFGSKLEINRADIHTIFKFGDDLRNQANQKRLLQIEQEKALKLLRLEEIRKEREGAFEHSKLLSEDLHRLVSELHAEEGEFRGIRRTINTTFLLEEYLSFFQKSRVNELNVYDVAILHTDLVYDAFEAQQSGAAPTLVDLGERAKDLMKSTKNLPALSAKVAELVSHGVLDVTEGLVIVERIDQIEAVTYNLNIQYQRLQKLDYEYFDLLREPE